MLKVGRDRIFDKNKNKERILNYYDVECDAEGWADSNKYLSSDYDLMHLKTEKKVYPGWCEGKRFEGANLHKNIKVISWKRNHFHED